MAHAQTQIRNKLKELLLGLPTTKQNVFFDYGYAIQNNQLPAICIFNRGESIEYITISSPSLQRRTLTVEFILLCKDVINGNTENKIEQIMLEVEKVLNDQANKKLGGLVVERYEVSTDTQIEILEQELFTKTLRYNFVYQVFDNNPDQII